MKYRILTPTIHGLLDYAAAAGLILLPFILGLGETSAIAQWLSIVGGIGLIAYSLATDYAFGVFGVIPMHVHLMLDVLAAIVLAAAPYLFGWTGLTFAYYLVMSAGVLVVVALSETRERAVMAGR